MAALNFVVNSRNEHYVTQCYRCKRKIRGGEVATASGHPRKHYHRDCYTEMFI